MKITRRVVQGAFLLLVLVGVFALSANCERWCPFGGVEAIYTYATEGNMTCSLATSNFFVLGGVLLSTLLLRRAFCSYICPIGTISEWVHAVAKRLRIPSIRIPVRLDLTLSLLKYPVLALILVLTWRAGELILRGFGPCYALIGRHGEDITYWAYVVSGAIVAGSLVVTIPFCRWLCPLAAVLNPFSRFSPGRIHRDSQACGNCGVCAKRCPMAIPVDRVPQVTAARCTGCLSCVAACPAGKKGSRALRWGLIRPIASPYSQAALLLILFACTAGAVTASYRHPWPSFVKSRGDLTAPPATVELQVENVTCRGRANLFCYFLERDDLFAVRGSTKVEAWPGPGLRRVRVSFDPGATGELEIKQALTEPYYDTAASLWRTSPFRVEGYDPLGAELDLGL